MAIAFLELRCELILLGFNSKGDLYLVKFYLVKSISFLSNGSTLLIDHPLTRSLLWQIMVKGVIIAEKYKAACQKVKVLQKRKAACQKYNFVPFVLLCD